MLSVSLSVYLLVSGGRQTGLFPDGCQSSRLRDVKFAVGSDCPLPCRGVLLDPPVLALAGWHSTPEREGCPDTPYPSTVAIISTQRGPGTPPTSVLSALSKRGSQGPRTAGIDRALFERQASAWCGRQYQGVAFFANTTAPCSICCSSGHTPLRPSRTLPRRDLHSDKAGDYPAAACI